MSTKRPRREQNDRHINDALTLAEDYARQAQQALSESQRYTRLAHALESNAVQQAVFLYAPILLNVPVMYCPSERLTRYFESGVVTTKWTPCTFTAEFYKAQGSDAPALAVFVTRDADRAHAHASNREPRAISLTDDEMSTLQMDTTPPAVPGAP